ncbi:acetyl-CoA synthetase [Clostridiales bacterium PH28_bin88]|nr:acetyl-CoA synthetase [Clostridiales bacterium PH28_bin88]
MNNWNTHGGVPKKPNLEDWGKAQSEFKWEETARHFSRHATGRLNIAHEAIDQNAAGPRGNKTALIFSRGHRSLTYTFADLRDLSNKMGNTLRGLGVQKGDRVCFLLPPCPELYISLLGAVKVGAIAVPLSTGLMGEAVNRLLVDAGAIVFITTPSLLNTIGDEPSNVKYTLVVGDKCAANGRRLRWSTLMQEASAMLEPEWMQPEDPMLLMYTSGSTGTPKGILHVHEGMLQYYQTGRWVLDLQEGDVYWCTADPGWITGISYGVWSPWLNGATSVVFAGNISADNCYAVIEKHKVTVWYSIPTYFRLLMAAGEDTPRKFDLHTLRHILSVGEPLNPAVIRWGLKSFGLYIRDTWFMTETGGQLICNFPCLPVKPGSMGKPIPGVEAAVLDREGRELPPGEIGTLAIRAGWPAMMRGVWRDPAAYLEYFRHSPWYLSGDLAYQDEDGYFWFQGRGDDIINTSGRMVSPFEVENRLVEHPAVAEVGVIGTPDPILGEKVKAFVVLRHGYAWSEELEQDLKKMARKGLPPFAVPRIIEVLPALPKTESGKIFRRALKAWDLGLSMPVPHALLDNLDYK